MPIREKSIQLVKDFYKEILVKEKWYRKLLKNNRIEILVLTGSTVQGNKDNISDLDIFLVCDIDTIKKLQFTYEYTYKKIPVEICPVSSKKLIKDATTKQNIYWWNKSVPIFCKNKDIKKTYLKACKYTQREKRMKMWANKVVYETVMQDLRKLKIRKDNISFYLNVNECLNLIIEAILIHNNVYKRIKWYGKELEIIDKNIYKLVTEVIEDINKEHIIEKLQILIDKFSDILKVYEFTQKEIDNWEKHYTEYVCYFEYN